jgi:lipopolysaccharide transport system ATP-binding protein
MSVIRVENLSKRYVLRHEGRSDTLRDAIAKGVRGLWRGAQDPASREEFWALRDVNLEVNAGEVVGIIGRNGAGKSTLLKILSRITEPTTGRVTLRGRVASLLEVGTGFHPELSGRENIFLNGAILGMSRAEIREKFDEIVAFAEVERFLDTPVKHYSSGMYVRLAFAVAAHLEPEILIVDEVLAVGDHEFQRKCLGRMEAVSRSGRTILFVSHNLESLRAICTKGVLLDSGRVTATGTISDVIGKYHHHAGDTAANFPPNPKKPTITRLAVDPASLAKGVVRIDVHYESPFPLRAVAGIVVSSTGGRPLFGSNMRTHPIAEPREAAAGVCTLVIPQPMLHSGHYAVSAWLGDKVQDFDARIDALSFNYVSPVHYPNRPSVEVIGPMDVPCHWEFSAVQGATR